MAKNVRRVAGMSITAALIIFLAAICVETAHSGPYLDSAHGNTATGADRSHVDSNFNSVPKGHCVHCHEQHAGMGGTEPPPNTGADQGPDSSLLFAAWQGSLYNNFCNECHDGTASGADNIASSYAKTYTHPTTGSHSSTEQGSTFGANRHAYCIDCHDPHIAQDTTHSPAVGGNTASGAVKGASGVEPSFTNPGTPLAGTEALSTPSYSTVSPITKEYHLCLKCHSSYAYGSTPPFQITNPSDRETDQGQEFNPDNYSHHPVTGTGQWKNATIRTNYTTLLKAPWNANLDARMQCSDCHGDDAGTIKGPHGSNKKYILKAWGGVDGSTVKYSTAAKSYDDLCLRCHIDGYANGSWPKGAGSLWSHGSNAAHQYEGEDCNTQNCLGCTACHGGPAGYADLVSDYNPDIPGNGGRYGAIHGENFMWKNPVSGSKNPSNPARYFLVGGYLTGISLDEYGPNYANYCWAAGYGGAGSPCGSMTGGKGW